VVALVPMRQSSERVPGKNYRTLGGKPLFHHIVGTLLDCPMISKVVIDTDSGVIAQSATESFDRVEIIRRPQHLVAGDVPMNEILLHDVAQLDGELFLQTHSTNPLLRPSTIVSALEAYAASDEYDSLFSVTAIQGRLWWGAGRPINHNPNKLLRTQDLPPVYFENSNLYLFDRKTLEVHRNRIGDRPLLYEINAIEGWDIDNESDFSIVESIYEAKLAAL
jgi:CMP-N-acetylneuraminic acid synthetase